MQNELQEAIAAYSAALLIDPQNAETHNNGGNVYTLLRERANAIADYTRAIEADPNYSKSQDD
jgi:tetratricopeptide (TPR) repeat protein